MVLSVTSLPSYLDTAFAKIPIDDSFSGIEEWPGVTFTVNCIVIEPFSDVPILKRQSKNWMSCHKCDWKIKTGYWYKK